LQIEKTIPTIYYLEKIIEKNNTLFAWGDASLSGGLRNVELIYRVNWPHRLGEKSN